MFNYQVASLPIEFTGVNFRDIYNYFPNLELDNSVELNHQRKLASYIQARDIMRPCIDPSYFAPGYCIRGRYQQGNYHNQIFYIDPEGPNMLLITGRPVELDLEEALKFRIKDTIYKYYWEDSKFGYLTQIVKYQPGLVYQLKSEKFITLL